MVELVKIWATTMLLALLYLMAGGVMDSLEQSAEQCRVVRCS